MSAPTTKQALRPTKDAIIRARCSEKLHARLNRIATVREVDFSDVVREACLAYANRVEQAMTAA